jgi:hypothetical protein
VKPFVSLRETFVSLYLPVAPVNLTIVDNFLRQSDHLLPELAINQYQ